MHLMVLKNSLKVACTTADASPAAGSFSRIRQTIEAQNLQPLAKGTYLQSLYSIFYVKTNKTESIYSFCI